MKMKIELRYTKIPRQPKSSKSLDDACLYKSSFLKSNIRVWDESSKMKSFCQNTEKMDFNNLDVCPSKSYRII